MKLSLWAKRNGFSNVVLAQLIGVARYTADRYLRNERPSRRICRKIEQITKGAVKENDFDESVYEQRHA